MNDEKGYQGWKNYETWCVALWIDNEESTYNWAREVVRDHKELYEVADVLKECIEEMNPLRDTSTMWTDLMNAALSKVDWFEIAKHYKEEE